MLTGRGANVTDLQGPPSERTQMEKIRDLKSLARQYARDRGSCDDTRISYLEYVESEAVRGASKSAKPICEAGFSEKKRKKQGGWWRRTRVKLRHSKPFRLIKTLQLLSNSVFELCLC
jgi:hypothetical protein